MTIKYASLLAVTKFRTRLGRSIVTVVAASLVASIMLISTFVVTGFENSVQGISQTPISKLNVAQESIFNRTAGRGGGPSSASSTSAPTPALTLDQYQSSIAKYNPQAVSQDESIGSFSLTSPALSTQNNQADTETVTARSDSLYTASLDSTAPPAAVSGTVPGVISSDLLLSLANITFSDTDTSAFKVNQTLNAENTWRGKVLTLTSTDLGMSPLTQKITIQGFLPSGSLFGGGQNNTIIIPFTAAQTSITKFPTATQNNTTFYASFSSDIDLLTFVQNEQSPRGTSGLFHRVEIYSNPLLQIRELEDQGRHFLIYAIIVLMAAVMLAMLTTLSKIISDSERETGVFRAIGARVNDIVQIYITYSTFVSILAMLLAVGIAVAATEFLNFRYSGNLTYELISLTGSSNLTTHITLFGLNWLNIGEIFLAIFFAALIGTLVPLISLLRKDPIKALRAE